MAEISYEIEHRTDAADAAVRTSALLDELVEKKPHLFNEVTWAKDGFRADMTGKGFKASFSVSPNTLTVNITLGLLARPFKGRVETALRTRLTDEFG